MVNLDSGLVLECLNLVIDAHSLDTAVVENLEFKLVPAKFCLGGSCLEQICFVGEARFYAANMLLERSLSRCDRS